MWYFMRIEIDNILVNVEIVRKNNKNTYMRVKNGVLVVTTNYMVSDRKMKEIIINNKNSIIKMLEKDNKLNEKIITFICLVRNMMLYMVVLMK